MLARFMKRDYRSSTCWRAVQWKRVRLPAHLTVIRRAAALGVVLCAAANGAFAQTPGSSQDAALIVGSRIRVTSSTIQSRVPGIIESIEDGVLTLRTNGGALVKFSLPSISRVDVSLGRKRSVLQGLAVGALAGFFIGFAPDVDPNLCGSDDPNFCSRGEALAGMTLTMGGIGAAVGTFIKRERWTRIEIAPSIPPGAGTARLAVTLRF